MKNWKDDAECRDADPDMFFPPEGVNIREARAVCARCPVQEQCLEYALKHNIEFGVWGGMSRREREILARKGGLRVVV